MSNKEKTSFEQVYLQFVKPIYYVAFAILKNKEDAEDVASDVFLSYYQMRNKEKIKNVKNYLFKMAHNKALNYLKRKNREELKDDIDVYYVEKDNFDNSLVTQIKKEIYSLPDEEKQIFVMHVNGGMGFRQISRIMKMSISAVYRRYKKAIKMLQQALRGGEFHE